MKSAIKPWLQTITPSGRALLIAVPYGFLLLFFMLPFIAVFKISFADPATKIPPYTDLLSIQDAAWTIRLNFEHYRAVLTDNLYIQSYLDSIVVAFNTTLICLLLGYPTAYFIARREKWRNELLMLVMLPFWTSYLIRVYAWIGILKDNGLLNNFLLSVHLIDAPLRLYHNNWGMYIGMVYSYLPYLILPLYAHLVKMDLTLLEAAHDLGAKPWKAFRDITLPLSMKGVIAGSLLVFIPAVGEYVIPELLGGSDSVMIGRVMWDDFFANTDWTTASATACIMIVLLLLPISIFQRMQVEAMEKPHE
ncbi:MAG: ABC transporter permease subunit [Methylophilaceae bacterium]